MQNYQLDDFFSKYEDWALNNVGSKSINDFNILLNKVKGVKQQELSEINDCFRLQVFMPRDASEIRNQYYHIYWNYYKAFFIAKSSDIKVQKIKLSDIYFDPENTVPKKMNIYRNIPQCEEPIIIADFVPSKQLIVIDGNHRCTIANEKNQETIEAYILSPRLHTNAFNSEVDSTYYDFHVKFLEAHSELGGIVR